MARHGSILLLIVFVYYLNEFCECTKTDLHLLGFLPMSGNGWTGGESCLPAVTMAIKDVNAHEGLLDDYTLVYSYVDSQCNPGLAVYKMFEALNAPPTYVMLLGGGCSTESEAMAQVSHLWNLTQLSYGSSSPILSDRKRFPRFFRIAAPDQQLNPSRLALMKHFNWNKVATINQAMEFFSVVIDDFVKKVNAANVTIISQEIFENDPTTRVENLKKHDARIIVIASYEDKARMILCAAYKIGLYGPRIVWFIVSWYSREFWRKDLDKVGCTAEQMDEVIEGAIISGFFFFNPVEERGIANMTVSEFMTRYRSLSGYNLAVKQNEFSAGNCYDHIWTAALAINCTHTKLALSGFPYSLGNFSYQDCDITDMMFHCLEQVSFTGIIGKMEFEEGANPKKNVEIKRIQGGIYEQVGIYKMDTDPYQLEWLNGGFQWKDGVIPRDSTYVTRKEIMIPMYLFAIMTVLAGSGVILAVVFFVFNIMHRNDRTVKMSSPNINNVLLLGCVISYVTVFVHSVEFSARMCKVWIVCFSLGFTVIFGALFSKTWRVYRIFTNKKLLKMTIKDYQLLAIMCVLVAVVGLFVMIWELVAPHKLVVKTLDKEVYMMGNDAVVEPYVQICYSDAPYFGWGLYLLEGALLAFGVFLAWETRHVKIAALNDSQQIGVCLYNAVVLSAVGLTLSFLLDQQVVMLYGVTSVCLIIGTTVTQVVIFVPKIRSVYYPGATVGVTTEHQSGIPSSMTGTQETQQTKCLPSEIPQTKEKP